MNKINSLEKSIEELINIGVKALEEIETARLDSRLLLGKILDKETLYLITNKHEKVSIDDEEQYLQLIEKRRNKMPVKYILEKCDFYGLDFHIEEGVLIPRSDTEILTYEVLKLTREDQKLKVCDLCTGSGAIAIALAVNRKNICVDAIDNYEVPERVTKINIKKNNMTDRVKFIKSDLLTEIIKSKKKYNIIVSNPPYIRNEEIEKLMEDVKNYEPYTALSGGEDGLYFYKKIIMQAKEVLLNEGVLAFEIGYDQGMQVKNLMEENNFSQIKVIKDLAGLDRVVIGSLLID